MSENGPEFAHDDHLDQEVPVDRENTLQMVRNDYEYPWKGVLREAIQNAADAWGRNISNGILPRGSELEIRIALDTSERLFTYKDNAGGMSRETLVENLVGIDTPDEVKQEGESAGAYGRGFHVVASVGTGKAYVETLHADQHNAVTLDKSGHHSSPKPPDSPQLSSQGTFIQVKNVIEHDIDGKLADWSSVEAVLLENFNFLLLHPNVSITYVIDGQEFEPEPVNLQKFVDEGLIHHEEELPNFTHNNVEYQIRNLMVVRTDAVDSEPPWEGVAMLKGNEYLDHPFMTVQAYKPHNIRSLNKPAKMFGWCNANELCPELENNAHTKFNPAALGKCGLKDQLLEIHNEHFRREQKTTERKELRGDITDHINELLISFDDFEDYQVASEGVEVPGGQGGNGADVATGTSSGYSIVCQAGKRDFEIGDNVPLQVAIENDDDSDIKTFEIYDIRVTSDVLDGDFTFADKNIDVGPNETKFLDLTGFTPEEEGQYIFRAKGRPEGQEDPIEHSNVYLRVGDVEPGTDSVPGGGGGGNGGDGGDGEPEESGGSGTTTSNQVAIVEAVSFSPSPDENYKVALEEGDRGGFEVLINTSRPEWSAAEEIDDDERRKQLQNRLGTLWGIEQIILTKNVDDLHEILSSYELGDDAADDLTNRLYTRDELMSEIEAIVATEHGVGYE